MPEDEPVDGVATVGRHQGPRGEVVLRRRTTEGRTVEELIVNGAFAMDSAETTTERQLARLAVAGGARRILVGGLGLGYTAGELLAPGVERVDVVEIEGALLAWARAGLTPALARVAADPRVRLHEADVSDVITGRAGPSGPWDAIVLDVDNGPDFLIHAGNARLYTPAVLSAAYARLDDPGVLLIWCQGVTPGVPAALTPVGGRVREHRLAVRRANRHVEYAIYEVARGAWPG